MKLLKIILIIFLIYFVRRFFQMYRVMKQVQAEQVANKKREAEAEPNKKDDDAINADFKVMD
jgi:flagellar basal body-associated protein FliL